jgi:hypothetical protein
MSERAIEPYGDPISEPFFEGRDAAQIRDPEAPPRRVEPVSAFPLPLF